MKSKAVQDGLTAAGRKLLGELKKGHEVDWGIYPQEDRIVVIPDFDPDSKQEVKSAGGIIIPDTAKDAKEEEIGYVGTVMVVGPGYTDRPMVRKPGDRVMYSKYSGTRVKFRGMKVLVMRVSDVLAALDSEMEKVDIEVE